jgi:Cu-Zn family superoxide dismutase
MKTIPAMILMSVTGALVAQAAVAAELCVPLYEANPDGAGKLAGTVVIRESAYGLLFQAKLDNLPAGTHGFHVHENASCAPSTANGKVTPAGAAGGHWDPDAAKQHAGPYDNGHRGDLPPLHASVNGKADDLVLAPRIRTLDELRGHALMVHAGGDNFNDQPMPLGGGGARMLCGVIPERS